MVTLYGSHAWSTTCVDISTNSPSFFLVRRGKMVTLYGSQARNGDALRKSCMVSNLRRYFHQQPLLLPGSKRETGDGLGSGAGRSKSLPAMLVEVHWQ